LVDKLFQLFVGQLLVGSGRQVFLTLLRRLWFDVRRHEVILSVKKPTSYLETLICHA
jgi:hypothetical protein